MGFQVNGLDGTPLGIDGNNQAKVTTSGDMAKCGYIANFCRNDQGDYTGATYDRNPEADADYRQRVAVETIFFSETWAGAALNSAKWSSNVTTMAVAVSGGYCKLNSAGIVTASTNARVTSYRTVPIFQPFPLYIDFPIQIVAAAVGLANTTVEFGVNFSNAAAAPTDGVFVRIAPNGEMRLVSVFASGTEVESAAIDYTRQLPGFGTDGVSAGALLPANTDRHIVIGITAHDIELWIDDVLVAEVNQPPNLPAFTSALHLPITFRVINGASAPASATQLWVGPVTVSVSGMCNAPSFADYCAMNGQGGYQGQSGGTMGQTCNWTNSAAPAAATLSNTTASYTTKGGKFLFNAIAGAETDYVLFSYTVPAAASGAHNLGMLVKSVVIDTVNIGAAVATTATVLEWFLAVGATADSLATAEGATTKAPRREPIGVQSFKVGDPIGAQPATIRLDLTDAPMYAEPGTRIQIGLRIPVGTATASEQFRGTATILSRHT